MATVKSRVLVSDDLADSGLAALRNDGSIHVTVEPGLSPAELIERISGYHALLVRSATQVTADVVAAAPQLQVIGRAGVGVDNIDLEAATRAGVIVVNAPTGNVVAAGEHTIAMLLALARSIPQADAHVRQGKWQRSAFVGVEVRDKVLGTVGLGRIAQEVVERANGLGMKVLAHDPFVTADYASQRGAELVSLDELLARSDFLTVHVPLTHATRHLIGREQLARMRRGARILNVARGGIIDEAALAAALDSGHIAGAAIDVFEDEPLAADSPLRRARNTVLTPHLGGSTQEAQEKVAADVAQQVLDVLNGRPARYAVNAPILPPKALQALIPYTDLAERMGRFVRQLVGQGIDRLEITAHGPIAEHDLAYIVAAAIKGLLSGVVEDRVNLINAVLLAERRGMQLMERKVVHHQERYENLLTLSASSSAGRPQEKRTVRGTFLRGEATLVALDDLWVEFPAQGNLLLTHHMDRPGIIGWIGTLLGQSDVNISFMHVGRRAPRGEAIMVLGTDEPISPALGQTLLLGDGIHWMKHVSL